MQPDSTSTPPRKSRPGSEARRRRVARGLPRYSAAAIAYEARRTPSKRVHEREQKRLIRERIATIKLARGCVDCGYNAHSAALDFDHLPSAEKQHQISQVGAMSWSKILAEIAKCEVVCSNCHRIRTFERKAEAARAARSEHMPYAVD